jgi:hypothetical protein
MRSALGQSKLLREEMEVVMPKLTEFALQLEDRPGTLGKFSQALADQGVNIIAFEAFPLEGQSSTVRIVVDNPAAARTVLNNQKISHKESEVAQAKLANRPGELARAASRLGEANININYAYCGAETGTNVPVLIFGVADANRATKILDEATEKAA